MSHRLWRKIQGITLVVTVGWHHIVTFMHVILMSMCIHANHMALHTRTLEWL